MTLSLIGLNGIYDILCGLVSLFGGTIPHHAILNVNDYHSIAMLVSGAIRIQTVDRRLTYTSYVIEGIYTMLQGNTPGVTTGIVCFVMLMFFDELYFIDVIR